MPLVALLDANVLWSAAVRDTLLRAAESALFRPVWSAEILGEVARNLKRRRPNLDPARIDRTLGRMRAHFPEALIEGYDRLIPAMQNDVKDRHVLAAAVQSGAEVIVTENVRDFPAAACAPYEIAVRTTDEFLCELWLLQSDAIVRVLHEQAVALTAPRQTLSDVLATLARSAPRFAALAQGAMEPKS
jgi:predicted nucleic acid-binding protein